MGTMHLEEQLQQGVRFFIPKTNDSLREAWVNKEGLLSGCLHDISIKESGQQVVGTVGLLDERGRLGVPI